MRKILPLVFWIFFLNDAFAQEICESAAVAISGTNSLPATTNNDYWYKYTASQDGKIQISSSAGNSIYIYSGVDCSSLSYEVDGYNNLVFTGLVNGETYYIQWYVFSGGNFDWTLTESDVVIGEDCNNAALASTGINNVPATTINEYWYEYTATQDGKIKINTSDNSNVTIYSGSNCSLLVNEVSGYNQIEFKQVLTDETYHIRWILNNGGDFDWTLTESLLEPGDTCEDPVEAVLGSNTSGATKFWYQFTAPSAGNYIISSVGTTTIDTYLKVFSDCSETLIDKNDDFEDYQSQVKLSLTSGQVIYILWEDTYSPYGFDWTLTKASGDDCNSAVLANAGTNTIPATANEEFWYEYTATRDGKIQINSTSGNGIYIYSGADCASLSLETIGGRNFSFTGATNGVTYYIQWIDYPEGNFEWTLTEADVEPGDDCSNAAIAFLGTNTVPATANSEFWYKYTATLNGKFRINSSADNQLRVYSGSNCSSRTFKGIGGSFLNINDVVNGETYYIRWYASGGNFDWTLTETPIQTGDSCEDPVQAILGTNTSEYASFWFRFTAPAAANYMISSVGTTTNDTMLRAYSDCEGTWLYENDDFSGRQSQIALSLTEGQAIYILWDDDWSPLGFDWTISSDIGQMDQTISFNPLDSKNFGDSDFELMATASSGLDVSYSSSDESVATIDGSTVTIVGAGTSTITASQSGNDYYHTAPNVERLLTVAKADQTLTFAIADQGIGNAPFVISATSNSGLANFTFDVIDGPASVSGSTLTLDGTEGFVEVRATEVGNDNYNSASITTTFQVKDPSKTDQLITFGSLTDKTFGDVDFELAAAASSGLTVSYSSSNPEVATVNGNTVTIVGAGSTTITASQDGDVDFNIAIPVSQTLTINKANQTITIEAIPDKTVTETPFDVLASTTSGLEITYAISGPASITGSTITLDGIIGEVTVTVRQEGNDNYNAAIEKSVSFNIVNGLTAQSITFEAINDQLFSNGTLTLGATASSGLDVAYEVISGPATVSGNIITFTDLGEVTVSALQAGNDVYSAATSVEQSFTIFKNEQTITFNAIGDQFFEAGSLTLSVTASSGLEVTFDIVSGPATISGSTVSFIDLGTITVSASQAGNDSFLAATSVEQSFDVITVTGVDGETSSLLIYPNPASNVLTIRVQQENAVMELLNQNGVVVMNIRPNAENNIAHLNNGIYFLRVSVGGDYSFHKIIKK